MAQEKLDGRVKPGHPGEGDLLPTTYYLLPTTYYLLPTTYCLLPTAYSLASSASWLAASDRRARSNGRFFSSSSISCRVRCSSSPRPALQADQPRAAPPSPFKARAAI